MASPLTQLLRMLTGSWLNVLLIAAPLSLALRWQSGVSVWGFVLAAVSLVPAAGLIGTATEHLARRSGPTLGGLLNATFGNAAELIIAIAALRAGRTIDSATPLARLIALDVDFHSAIYSLSGNPAIEEMIAPQWPHMRRSMATVLAELDYRESAWAEHETIAAHVLAGNARAAEAAALAHAQTAGRMTEEKLRAIDVAA